MTKLFVMNVSPLAEDELFKRVMYLVSEERRKKVLRLSNRINAALSLGAELLLRYALINCFGIKEKPVFSKSTLGKPFFHYLNGINFNLSHSGEYVVCIISDEFEVGIDIQQIRSANFRIAKRVLLENAYDELEKTVESERAERFCELWVLHESTVKLFGGSALDRVDTEMSKLINAPHGYKMAIAIKK